MTAPKLWANSGDSHFLEPEDLWRSRLPRRLAELVPRTEKDPDGRWESSATASSMSMVDTCAVGMSRGE